MSNLCGHVLCANCIPAAFRRMYEQADTRLLKSYGIVAQGTAQRRDASPERRERAGVGG